jgi:probable non-F420 flavinoid oxidoreductase
MPATRYSYHVSHEQISPRDLLGLVQRAESAGFDAAFSSDHFHPWAPSQGHSGNTWAWLGAAMATTRLPFGVITVPGYRYHPAVLAQQIATLGQMFPGRLWVALGSGENVNEHIVGGEWPPKPERNALLEESADVMRALLRGVKVTHRNRVTVLEAKLYDLPEVPMPFIGACVTEATAEWLGSWADGLLTTGVTADKARKVVEAFRRGGGEGKPIHLKIDLCWARTEDEALRQAHERWRFNALGADVNWDLRTPEQFEHAARFVRPEDMRAFVRISEDLGRHVAWIQEFAAIGFDSIDLHHVGADQEAFIDAFGAKVLPEIRKGT